MILQKLFPIVMLFLSFNLTAQTPQYVDMGAETITVDNQKILAITFNNSKDWHTYWKNPGDAGLEIKLKMSIAEDKEIQLKEYPWPAPKRYIEQGDMWAFGYSKKYAFFYQLEDHLKNKELKIVGQWLVCKDICIPGTRTIHLNLNENLDGNVGEILSKLNLVENFKNLPILSTSNKIKIFLTKGQKENQLALHYLIENADFSKINRNSSVLTPYIQTPFDYKHEEIYLDEKTNTIYGRMYLDWDGIFEEPIWNLPKNGVFEKPITAKFLLQYPKSKSPIILEKTFKEFTLTGDKLLSDMFDTLSPLNKKTKPESVQKIPNEMNQPILMYLLFAFLGGLILNLMPCVLPVISLKLFGLIVHSDESKKTILKHNLAYTAGVLFSFLTLAIAVMSLKMSGDEIGWGFQLQSPLFVFIMVFIIFIMALNMLGLFEFATPGGKSLGNAEIKKGISADFVNGILATILSTPCSAPFLGTALTFAFTTSYLNIYLIFISVGIGLSFPFILTGFFPSLIKFLPKPGAWMDKLKNILGLSLILTAVWLTDVLFGIVDFNSIGIYFNSLLVFTFFAFYFRKFISKKLIYNIIVFLIPLFFMYQVSKLVLSPNSQVSSSNSTQLEGSMSWKKWTPEAMKKAPGNYVFMDFTAKWCLTCKVNKKIVLHSDDFKDLVNKKKLTLLQADWTKRDDNITRFLKKYNIVGVPAYFIQKPNGEILSLGETISVGKIKDHLK